MANNLIGLLEFDKFRLDTEKKLLWCNGKLVDLRPKAAELLCVLVARSGEVLPQKELLEAIWPDSFVEESNLTHQIYELRKMFRDAGCAAEIIQTVPRRGYRFTAEVSGFSEREEIITERQTFTEVMIEEISDDGSINLRRGTDTGLYFANDDGDAGAHAETEPRLQLSGRVASKRLPYIIAAAFGLVVTVAAVFGFWRYQEAGNGRLTAVRSIAVLPIKSFEKADDELRIRLTDSLITRLGRIAPISVRPTSSILRFSNSEADPIEIGRMLEVDAVIDSRIQRENSRLRVTIQLLSVKDGEKIWSEQFDGDDGRLLDLQDAIALRLLTKIEMSLSAEERMDFSRRPTASSEAFEEFLTARYFWQKRTPESLRSAIAAFERTIRLDPEFAEAYVGLADSYFLLVDYSYDTSPGNIVNAQENLAKAIGLNPNLAEAHTTSGYIQTAYLWKWEAGEESLLRAIGLAPNLPNGHHRYGMFCLKLRRFAEAEKELRRARELDPTSPAINTNIGVALFFAKRYDEAIAQFGKALELDPSFLPPRWLRARCLWLMGAKDESVKEYIRAVGAGGDKATVRLVEKYSEDPSAAIRQLSNAWRKQIGPTGISEHSMAILSASLQERDETLGWLEKAVAARHPWVTSINAEPEFDFVRDDPRFREILKKINLNGS